MSDYLKEYYKKNKDKYKKSYDEKRQNPDYQKKQKEYQKEYYQKNLNRIKEYANQYSKNRYHANKHLNTSELIKIYRIIFNEEVIYVGLTRMSLSRRKNSANYSIPKEIYKQSTIELIEETIDAGRERYWIEYYLEIGAPLMNKRNGNYSKVK